MRQFLSLPQLRFFLQLSFFRASRPIRLTYSTSSGSSFHSVPDAAFRIVIIRGKSKMVLFYRRRRILGGDINGGLGVKRLGGSLLIGSCLIKLLRF